MAAPTTLRFGAGVFYIGDGASPEVFTKVCGFNSSEVTIDKSTSSTTVPDCDDVDEAAWEEKDVSSKSWSMSFSGVAAVEALPTLETATLSGVSVNVRLDLLGAGTGAGTTTRRYAGAAHVKSSLTGQRGERWSVKVDVEGDGALTISSVAAS